MAEKSPLDGWDDYDVPTDAEKDSPGMRYYVDQDVARLKKMLGPDQASSAKKTASGSSS